MNQADTGARRRFWFRATLLLGGLLGGYLLGEIAVRLRVVSPNRQIVRGRNLREIAGVPVWEDEGYAARENLRCLKEHSERIRVAFFGNSVTAGSSLMPPDVFTTLLQDRLNAARPSPGFCVMNFAEPGFHHNQEIAFASEVVQRDHPAVAFLQEGPHPRTVDPGFRSRWAPAACNPWRYKVVGDAAFELDGLAVRGDGYPALAFVPDVVNRVLFDHSELYRYLTLAGGEPERRHEVHGDYMTCRQDQLAEFQSLAQSGGAKPVVYLAADLSYPLNEMEPDETLLNEPLVDFGQQRGLPVYQVRRMIADQDFGQIRIDNWHLNAAGHKVLADRFVPIVLGVLDGHPPPPRGAFFK